MPTKRRLFHCCEDEFKWAVFRYMNGLLMFTDFNFYRLWKVNQHNLSVDISGDTCLRIQTRSILKLRETEHRSVLVTNYFVFV